eukprot:TRINITY_DN23920_c0_g1_i2.p1 TRINITY_DN23920_c0_g1~~TRINITY_DN23920_c0_g1_i2.p1  ORF type:complete len:601 (-),score=59.50 TRINITY_DN23920_c0_g1_i2:423-2225(-)
MSGSCLSFEAARRLFCRTAGPLGNDLHTVQCPAQLQELESDSENAQFASEALAVGDLSDLLLAAHCSDEWLPVDIGAGSWLREQARWAWDSYPGFTANDAPFPRPLRPVARKEPFVQDSAWDCAICLQSAASTPQGSRTVARVVQMASCAHVFHTRCIHRWLLHGNSCPVCRCSPLRPFRQARPWHVPKSSTSLAVRPALSQGLSYLQSLPIALQARYDQLGEWITPLSSIQEVIGLRAQGSLQLPLVPPAAPAAEEQGHGLYMYSRTTETQAIESAEWQRILAVKLAERQLWGCFNDVPFPNPRLWHLQCSAQLPPCAPDLLRGLMHAESTTMVCSADLAWEVFPLSVLGEAAIDEWSESCHGSFCRRAESEPFVTTISESCAWEQLSAEAILHDQLSHEQLLVESIRAGRVISEQKMRERQICLAARFNCASPSEGFFGDCLPKETDPVGPEAVVSRWKLYKTQAGAALTLRRLAGALVTIFPAAGRWPGSPLSRFWARRCWAKLGAKILECDRHKEIAGAIAKKADTADNSPTRCSVSTPDINTDNSSLNSSGMTFTSQSGSMAQDAGMQWTPRSSRPSVKLCQSGFVAQMISRYGG